MNRKTFLLFAAMLCFLCAGISQGSEQTRNESILITSQDTSGQTFYQIATIIETSGGGYDSTVTDLKDSIVFQNEIYARAHNIKLPVKRAIQILAERGRVNQEFNFLNDILVTATGKNYFTHSRDRGNARGFVGKWRIIGEVDTVSVDAFFMVNANGLGTQITSFNDETPVIDGLTCRLLPYEQESFRITQLFPGLIEIAFLFAIPDEDNPNSPAAARRFYTNEFRNGSGGIRCIKFPD